MPLNPLRLIRWLREPVTQHRAITFSATFGHPKQVWVNRRQYANAPTRDVPRYRTFLPF